MLIELTDVEARILGCLVEKSLTTPDLYPLTLNSLTNACNQKSNRDPVMSLEEGFIGKSLYPLIEKGLVEQSFEVGTRVPKFKHHIEKLLRSSEPKEVAIVCVMLLRGPQTAGELKTRTERLCRFESAAEVEAKLQELAAQPEPYIVKLARQSGQKESRYQHLFCGPAPAGQIAPKEPPAPHQPKPAPALDRVAQLEKRVEALEARVKALEAAAGTVPERGTADAAA